MTDIWIWGLIASLIVLAIGTTLKSAHDAFLAKQSDKEVIRLTSEIEALKKSHSEAIFGISESNSAEKQKLANEICKTPEKTLNQRLEETKENILLMLAAHPDVTDRDLSDGMNINIQITRFHLTELEENKFVHASYSTIAETEWSIAHGGRAYLVQHGLLS